MQDFTIIFGHYSLALGWLASGWTVAAALLAAVCGQDALQKSAERAIYLATACVGAAMFCLWHGFLGDDFRINYVYQYSSMSQALPYKIGALWGGQAGSLLLWTMMLSAFASLMVATNQRKNRPLMPWATAVVGLTMVFFFFLINVLESPFATGGMRPDGVGLNPQLKNYWMMIHPPTLYLGYVAFTVPFAFGIAALITRRTGDLWFRTTRRWTISAWFFLGGGILLGSYWAYVELGWGGYWAWDPVENASLMPWLTGTAFLHSVMIQEKKGMMKVWNMLLIILTFSLSIFGTFLTRSGVISSVHAFATSDIGPAFGFFLIIIFFGSMALLLTRLDNLKSETQLESVLSRESSFLFNNMIFVGIAATVLLLTTFPMLSEAATNQKVTMGPEIFNLVNVPWALALLLLMGWGPLVAWRKATRKNLERNFVVPGLLGLWVFLAFLVSDVAGHIGALRGSLRTLAGLDLRGFLDQVKDFYPAITFGLGAFVIGTVGLEFWRGARVRMRRDGENPLTAVWRMTSRDKRRYGGYVVHVGMVLVFFGVAISSAYRYETSQALFPGQFLEAEGYWMRYDGYRLEAVDDHLGAVTEISLFDAATGQPLGHLEAEQRFHPQMLIPELKQNFLQVKQLYAEDSDRAPAAIRALYATIPRLEQRYRREVKTPSTEVGIHKTWSPLAGTRVGEDFYVIPLAVDPGTGRANFRVFVNPMVNFLWLGGFVFVLGAFICVLPDRRERRRLEAAMALEDRAVA